jgi:chemotaxis regulatin CheY-phosphate phosphatase CheZ
LHDSLFGVGLDKFREPLAWNVLDVRRRVVCVAKTSKKATQGALNTTGQ